MKKPRVDFGKIITILSPDFGNQPVKICLRYDLEFKKSGVHYISVLSPLAQAIYQKYEGEEAEYLSQGKKQKVHIIKIQGCLKTWVRN